MEIKKGSLLEVKHCRKGCFKAIAIEDFDTETTTFYPVRIAVTKEGGDSNTVIEGMGRCNNWVAGEEIPCRNSLCSIKVLDTPN